MAFITARRATAALSEGMSFSTALLTRSVTSTMSMSTFSSIASHLNSSARVRAWKPRVTKSFFLMPVSFWRASSPTWWLVMTSPSAETKLPDPPELNRTDAFWTCSSHFFVTLKSYFFWRYSVGGALNSHIPSSPFAVAVWRVMVRRAAARAARLLEVMSGPLDGRERLLWRPGSHRRGGRPLLLGGLAEQFTKARGEEEGGQAEEQRVGQRLA